MDGGQAFIEQLLARDGLVLTRETLANRMYLITAAVMKVYMASTSRTAVTRAAQACNLALKVNEIAVEPDFLVSLIRTVSNRERSAPLRQVAATTFGECEAVLRGTHQQGRGVVYRMLGVATALSFVALLRYSDLALVNLKFVYFLGRDGFLFCLGRRKNDQHNTDG